MWQIEIRDNSDGPIPGKLRKTHVSKLPDIGPLVHMDRFAVMSRIKPPVQPDVVAICRSCKRRQDIMLHIKKQRDLRAAYGPNVTLFPSFARREN